MPPPPHGQQQKDERTWTQNADSARAYQLDRNVQRETGPLSVQFPANGGGGNQSFFI